MALLGDDATGVGWYHELGSGKVQRRTSGARPDLQDHIVLYSTSTTPADGPRANFDAVDRSVL
jgi:hypothetical protein